jgi:hypothetical protein
MNTPIKRALHALDQRIDDILDDKSTMIEGEFTMALEVILQALKTLPPEDRTPYEIDLRNIKLKIESVQKKIAYEIQETRSEIKTSQNLAKGLAAYGKIPQ